MIKNENGKNEAITVQIKSRYTNVFSYLCIASVQYIAPICLFLSILLILIRYGDFNFHIFEVL